MNPAPPVTIVGIGEDQVGGWLNSGKSDFRSTAADDYSTTISQWSVGIF